MSIKYARFDAVVFTFASDDAAPNHFSFPLFFLSFLARFPSLSEEDSPGWIFFTFLRTIKEGISLCLALRAEVRWLVQTLSDSVTRYVAECAM